ATSVMAALRRQSEVALANVIGSNIFNILAILGLTAIIVPVPVASGFITFDAPLMVLIAGLMLVVVIATATIGRSIGIAFLTIYAAYLAAQGIQS
ncbi:MAG TPA: sodium:calcium antiporter, partial [Hyphomicrobiales bacterium]|nr:sodium:calcium antiporter [Hyphomicrobiales bacterium]